jgi:predicted Zn-dependent protease
MKKNNKWRISRRTVVVISGIILLIIGCATNPLTGKRTMAFVGNSELFPMAFAQYDEFLKENKVVTGTADAAMVERVGTRIAIAAQKWLESEGNAHYLDDYRWEYKLVDDDTVNAWCLPGGKIVVYTGILPVTKTEAGLAVVLGHEVSHALLNHGQQNMSAGLLQQLGTIGVALGAQVAGLSEGAQSAMLLAYSLGSSIGGMLPFSRSHESEADHYGLILMTIAGYNPDEAVPFWQRMSALGGSGTPQFLSTHPSHATRIQQLAGWNSEAKQKAAQFGVYF